jgi:hypothetical protein
MNRDKSLYLNSPHDGLVRFSSCGSPALAGRIEAFSLSSTGPDVVRIVFARAILHTVEVGPEVVSITLAEEVT